MLSLTLWASGPQAVDVLLDGTGVRGSHSFGYVVGVIAPGPASQNNSDSSHKQKGTSTVLKIDIAQIKPASDAVQAAQSAMQDINNELTHLELERPRDAEKIRQAKEALEIARGPYLTALFELSVKVHEVIKAADLAEGQANAEG